MMKQLQQAGFSTHIQDQPLALGQIQSSRTLFACDKDVLEGIKARDN